MSFTTSPIEIMPISRPSLTTGRWRRRRSVISAMHSSRLWPGATLNTGELMTSRTAVSFEERPRSTILRE
jgi:hypothetical protein